jgi:hypothetical protein
MYIDLTNVVAVLFVLAPLTLLLIRIFVVPDGTSLDHLIPPPRELEWPRGVQEEEPVRWRIERLTQPQRQASAESAIPPDKRRTRRQAIGAGRLRAGPPDERLTSA